MTTHRVTVSLGPTATAEGTRIIVDGVDITTTVRRIAVTAGVDEMTRVSLDFLPEVVELVADYVPVTRRRRGRKPPDPEIVRRARQLYEDGHTLAEVGDIVGVSQSTAHRWVTA